MDRLVALLRQLLALYRQTCPTAGAGVDLLDPVQTQAFFAWLQGPSTEPDVHYLKTRFGRELLHLGLTQDESFRIFVLGNLAAVRDSAPPRWHEQN